MIKSDLYEKNRELELAMSQTAKSRLEDMINNGGEHSLEFSMFIKKTFEQVYHHIKDNKPPFDVYLQQSAYTIAASLIHCVYKETPLRDIINGRKNGLKESLGWKVELDGDYVATARDDLVDAINREHRKMFNLITNIIDAYPQLDKLKSSTIYGYQGIITKKQHSDLEFFLIQLIDLHDDEYIESIAPLLRLYVNHIQHCSDSYVGVVCNSLKGCRTDISNRLLSKYTVNDMVEDIFSMYSTYSSHNIEDMLIDEWFTNYILDVIDNVRCVECRNGDDYGEVGFVVSGTDEVKEQLAEYIKKESIVHPTSLPILIKPLEWTMGDTEGGFHHIRTPFLPTRESYHQLPYKTYLDGINKIQGTGFTVNAKLWEFAKLIGYTDAIHKTKPRGWSKDRYRRDCESKKSKNRDMNRIMDIAKDYMEYPDYWFTMYGDFRGRGYYRQEYFSPQGQDLSKALQNFNVGYRVDKKALKWIRVNLANLGGKDDISYKERVKWVKRNESKIREAVSDPEGSKEFIMSADKPWQFLAACIDYVEYLENPDTHLSRLPVGMDGKCNGTQHWCAMLKDLIGGAKVALTDSDKPSDLYSEVLVNLISTLDVTIAKTVVGDPESAEYTKAMNNKEWSLHWKDSAGLKRKLVKTPTMTTTYAAGKKAFRGYVTNYCVDNGIIFSEDPIIQKRHVNFMVDEIIKAIDMTVSVKGGMRFVQDVVTGIDEVHFETPIGFHVYMSPKRTFNREFKVRVDGRVRKVTFAYEGDSADNLAIHTGIAPNFVHSMDATHMLMVVNDCPHITHWMMIHDQFSCHACFVDDMQKSIRKTFVKLYGETDQLERFRTQLGKTEDDVKLPTYGDLDITSVLKSKYFFS